MKTNHQMKINHHSGITEHKTLSSSQFYFTEGGIWGPEDFFFKVTYPRLQSDGAVTLKRKKKMSPNLEATSFFFYVASFPSH